MSNKNQNNLNPSGQERDRDSNGGLHDAQAEGNLGTERNRNSDEDTSVDALEDNLGNERGRDHGYLGEGSDEI